MSNSAAEIAEGIASGVAFWLFVMVCVVLFWGENDVGDAIYIALTKEASCDQQDQRN